MLFPCFLVIKTSYLSRKWKTFFFTELLSLFSQRETMYRKCESTWSGGSHILSPSVREREEEFRNNKNNNVLLTSTVYLRLFAASREKCTFHRDSGLSELWFGWLGPHLHHAMSCTIVVIHSWRQNSFILTRNRAYIQICHPLNAIYAI